MSFRNFHNSALDLGWVVRNNNDGGNISFTSLGQKFISPEYKNRIISLTNQNPRKLSDLPFINQHNNFNDNLNKSEAVYKSKESVNGLDNMEFLGTKKSLENIAASNSQKNVIDLRPNKVPVNAEATRMAKIEANYEHDKIMLARAKSISPLTGAGTSNRNSGSNARTISQSSNDVANEVIKDLNN